MGQAARERPVGYGEALRCYAVAKHFGNVTPQLVRSEQGASVGLYFDELAVHFALTADAMLPEGAEYLEVVPREMAEASSQLRTELDAAFANDRFAAFDAEMTVEITECAARWGVEGTEE
jgi:hypothetical protein